MFYSQKTNKQDYTMCIEWHTHVNLIKKIVSEHIVPHYIFYLINVVKILFKSSIASLWPFSTMPITFSNESFSNNFS